MRSSRTTALGLAGALAIGLMAGCSSTGSPTSPTTPADAAAPTTSAAPVPVTITVAGNLPGASQDNADQLAARVKEFEAKYPYITVEPQEYQWLATTFTAQLAGGTLPTVFEIPVTDGKTLIENKQLADIDAQVKADLPYYNDFNPAIVGYGQDPSGKFFAVPAKNFYANALHINRNLFTQAGLDPDKPPTTWAEVKADAKTIHDKTGVYGFGQMGNGATGGWQLAVDVDSRGGSLEKANADGTYTATLTDPAVKSSLEWLASLAADGSIDPDTSLDWSGINAAFASGQFAMFTSGSDVYNAMVQTNNMTADWGYGLGAVPTENGGSALGGGTLAAVKANATDAEKDAAVKWIDFWYLSKLRDQDQAVADAKVAVAAKQPVGTPVLPIFSQAQYQTSLTWIKDYINVPLQNMKGYTDVMFSQPVGGEPKMATQAIYQLLSPVFQAVLTDKHADIDKLLADANVQAQDAIDHPPAAS
jgi:ABC-type glycerol-3-phosphate transport system substrate-binding protein